MRLSKEKSLAPGPAGRFESGQSDSGSKTVPPGFVPSCVVAFCFIISQVPR